MGLHGSVIRTVTNFIVLFIWTFLMGCSQMKNKLILTLHICEIALTFGLTNWWKQSDCKQSTNCQLKQNTASQRRQKRPGPNWRKRSVPILFETLMNGCFANNFACTKTAKGKLSVNSAFSSHSWQSFRERWRWKVRATRGTLGTMCKKREAQRTIDPSKRWHYRTNLSESKNRCTFILKRK